MEQVKTNPDRIFLDANTFLDVVEMRDEKLAGLLANQNLFIAEYSLQVLTYIYKYKVPNENLNLITSRFNLAFSDSEIVNRALLGPTDDYEDNIQLHLAVSSDCDLFLTKDKTLLKMGYFGRMKVSDKVQ